MISTANTFTLEICYHFLLLPELCCTAHQIRSNRLIPPSQISEEEGVLACALWPKLCQLVLHNNPVITQCRGLPILLTHELTLRNGITIIRNPPSKVKKPPSVTVSASSRRVKEPPRPLPRQPHPDLLALESAPALALPPSTPGLKNFLFISVLLIMEKSVEEAMGFIFHLDTTRRKVTQSLLMNLKFWEIIKTSTFQPQ